MAKNYWMFVESPENFAITKDLGFTLHGLGPKYRRRVERMRPDDRVLFCVSGLRKWVATATITSRYFEDNTPIWKSVSRNGGFPYRVNLAPDIVVDEADYIDALILAPRLEYVKRWAPEDWPLAFMDRLHLLPQRDFRLIEGEMKRVVNKGRRRQLSHSDREQEAAGTAGNDDLNDAVDGTGGAEALPHSPVPAATQGVIEGSPPEEGAHRTPLTDTDGGGPTTPTAETQPRPPNGDPEPLVIEESPPEERAHRVPQTDTDGGSPTTPTAETQPRPPNGDPERVVIEGSPPEGGAPRTRLTDTDGGSPTTPTAETHPLPPDEGPERL